MCIMAPVSPIASSETSARDRVGAPHKRTFYQLPGIHIEPNFFRPPAVLAHRCSCEWSRSHPRQGGGRVGRGLAWDSHVGRSRVGGEVTNVEWSVWVSRDEVCARSAGR